MKKFLLAMLVACMGVFGLASTAVAGGSDYYIICNEEWEDVCLEEAGDDDGYLVDVELKCTGTGPFTGDLELRHDGDWYLNISDDGDTVCDMDGDLEDNNYMKVEVKCTMAEKGPPQGNNNYAGGASVEAEIKITDYDSDCVDD